MEVNPLVFETSASTNSAIWALAAAKVCVFFELTSGVAFFCLFENANALKMYKIPDKKTSALVNM
jgi:hypothetical protein